MNFSRPDLFKVTFVIDLISSPHDLILLKNFVQAFLIMSQAVSNCPYCKENLRKCLIQQNYSIVTCSNEKCMYPFNETEIKHQIVHVSDKEILEVAKFRLKNDRTPEG